MYLIEESNDLAGNVLPSRFLMVHDPRRGRENDVTKLA